MNTIKILVTILLVAILGALTWAIFLPSDINISKSIEIEAPVNKVFKQVNNFRNWGNWAPYQDSSYNARFEGNNTGVGAKMLWSDEKEGESINTIIVSEKNKKIVTELAFNEDKKAMSIFLFKEQGGITEITWQMNLKDLSYPFGRFVGYMIQKGAEYNFTLGLTSLKKFVESNKDVPDYNGYQIHDDIIVAKSFIGKDAKSTMTDFHKTIGDNFKEIINLMGSNNIAPTGYPVIVWNNYKPEGISEFTCLMEINSKSEVKNINYNMHRSFPERRVVWLEYRGSYEKSSIAWETLDSYITNQELQMNGSPYEEYVTDPSTEPDTNKWITNIYFPVMNK